MINVVENVLYNERTVSNVHSVITMWRSEVWWKLRYVVDVVNSACCTMYIANNVQLMMSL